MCSSSAIWWSEQRESWLQLLEEEVEVEWPHRERGSLCRLAGVLGGVGQMSSVGGTEKTTGNEEAESLLISSTWMGAEWLRRFTWYF